MWTIKPGKTRRGSLRITDGTKTVPAGIDIERAEVLVVELRAAKDPDIITDAGGGLSVCWKEHKHGIFEGCEYKREIESADGTDSKFGNPTIDFALGRPRIMSGADTQTHHGTQPDGVDRKYVNIKDLTYPSGASGPIPFDYTRLSGMREGQESDAEAEARVKEAWGEIEAFNERVIKEAVKNGLVRVILSKTFWTMAKSDEPTPFDDLSLPSLDYDVIMDRQHGESVEDFEGRLRKKGFVGYVCKETHPPHPNGRRPLGPLVCDPMPVSPSADVEWVTPKTAPRGGILYGRDKVLIDFGTPPLPRGRLTQKDLDEVEWWEVEPPMDQPFVAKVRVTGSLLWFWRSGDDDWTVCRPGRPYRFTPAPVNGKFVQWPTE